MSARLHESGWQRVFLLAVLVGMVHMLVYAWWTPPWQNPDEPRHYEYVRLIGELGRPPGWNDTDPTLEATTIRSMARFDFWRFGFAVGGYVQHRDQTFAEIWTPGNKNVHIHPPLYYRLMATLTNFLPRQAMVSQLLLLRLLSVVIGTFSLLLIGLTGVALASWKEGAALIIFAALVPGHAAINAAVNNDVLTELFGVLTVAAGVLIMRRGVRPVPLFFLLVGLALAVMTKRSSVFLLAYALLSLLTAIKHYHFRRQPGRWLLFGMGLLLFTTVAGAWAAWRLGRVGMLAPRLQQLAAWDTLLPLLQQFPCENNLTLLFQSFWARLGWLTVPLPSWAYTLLLLSTLLALFGWAGVLSDWRRLPSEKRALWRDTGLTFVLTLLLQLALTLGKGLVYVGTVAQGRYIYPFFPAYALFYVHGWGWWARRLRLPPLTSQALFLALVSLLTLAVMIHTYYGG